MSRQVACRLPTCQLIQPAPPTQVRLLHIGCLFLCLTYFLFFFGYGFLSPSAAFYRVTARAMVLFTITLRSLP